MKREARIMVGLIGLALLAFTGLGARLYWVQIERGGDFYRIRERQTTGRQYTTYRRWDIKDVGGRTFATSVRVASVAAVPDQVRDPRRLTQKVSKILGLEPERVYRALTRSRDGKPLQFAWIRRKVTPEQADAIVALKDPGVRLEPEFRRSYPHGRLLAHGLGVVNIDEKGMSGVERTAETWLAQEVERTRVGRDGSGSIFARAGSSAPLRGDVYLTVDLEFQKIVEEEMRKACERYRPQWACAVAMNPETGDLLALSVMPDYDPNLAWKAPLPLQRNRALTDPYEPGSLLKPLVVAGALQYGLVTPGRVYDCGNGRLRIPGRTIHDHKPFSQLSVSEIIAHSSNVGAVRIAMEMGSARAHETLKAFGIGHRTGIDLPAEDPGRLQPLSRWTRFTLSSAPMGYELMATPIQIARAFCVIANGGVLVRPRIVSEVRTAEGHLVHWPRREPPVRILEPEVAAQMRRILRGVMEGGTGRRARIEGLSSAGKTGTTQVLVNGQYRHDRHIASFAGFAPAEEALVCMAIVFSEPQGASYGGQVAAPVFKGILERGIDVLQERPRRVSERRRILRTEEMK